MPQLNANPTLRTIGAVAALLLMSQIPGESLAQDPKPQRPAGVELGELRTSAALESNVRYVTNRGQGGLRYCYEKTLQYNRRGGEVVLEWTINAEGGVVGDALTCSTIDNRGVESCLQRVVRRWRFKPCKGGDCQVSQTVLFHNTTYDETRSCSNKPGS